MIEAIAAAALLVIVALGVLRASTSPTAAPAARRRAPSLPPSLSRIRSACARSAPSTSRTTTETHDGRGQQGQVHDPVARRLGPRLDRRHPVLQQQHDAGRLHADHLDADVAADQHPDPAGQDVQPRRAARSARSAPTRARSASRSTTPPARAWQQDPVTISGPPRSRTRPTRPAARSSPTSRSAPTPASVTHRLGRQGRQPERHGRRHRQPGHRQRRQLVYDEAASVDATFDTETAQREHDERPRRPTTQLSASNADVPSGPFSPAAGQRV